MKNNLKLFKSLAILAVITGSFLVSSVASAATSPGMGAANSFVILSSTYSNSASGTTLNGDLGYTVPPATNPTVNGATQVANSVYNQAGIDQGNALINLNNQPCSFQFAPGPVDLASDTTHGPVGVYTPGVYCVSGAASIGGGGTITLNGAGTYIFRMDGELTTSANSVVVLANGASACDVWWTPTAATTLGANSTFVGTDIAAAGIAIGSTVNWTGQALAFGGTVSTASDTISTATCTAARANTPAAPTTTPGLPDTSNAAIVSQAASTAAMLAAGTAIIFGAVYLIRKNR